MSVEVSIVLMLSGLGLMACGLFLQIKGLTRRLDILESRIVTPHTPAEKDH
jgi:hypothetical protein